MKRVTNLPDVAPANPESPYTEHHLYRVALGNHRQLHFRSKRDALAYTADTNRWLNELMLEANTLFAEAFMEYRQAWPMLSDVQHADLRDIETALKEILDQCGWHLDRAALKRRRADGLYHGWKAVMIALTRSGEVFTRLEAFYRYKTQGVLRWRMVMRRRQCDHAIERMEEYGSVPPYGAHSTAEGV